MGLTEPMADETLIFLDYGGPASLMAKIDAEEKVAVGDRRHFIFSLQKVRFFDVKTGGRILR